jgi:hypothetical protein
MEVRKRKTFPVQFSKLELLHLRDLFNVKLPLELKQTVSQALAEGENRVFVETQLWLKLVEACKAAELPLDEEAPDFVCTVTAAPPIGVFRMASEPNEGEVQSEANDPFEGQKPSEDA